MAGISPVLRLRLRKALSRCAPVRVDEYDDLEELFLDSRLSSWADELSLHNKRNAQVHSLITLLISKQNNATNENALVIFLRVLSDSISPDDGCKLELEKLADELEEELALLNATTEPSNQGQDETKPKSNKTIFLIFAIVAVIIVVFQLAKNLPPVISTPSSTIEARQTTSPQGVPLSIEEMYPQDTKCYVGGTWAVDLWVKPAGGNGTYTYYNNDEWVAGPTDTGVVISLQGETAPVVEGIIIVDSDGQRKSQNYSVDMPEKCR